MFKTSGRIFGWVGLVLLLAFFIVGCRASSPTSSPTDLSPSQAAEIIYNDLSFHGIRVDKVTVASCVFKDRNTALVEATYTTQDGKNFSQKVTLVKENGKWLIEDHSH